MFYFLNKGSVLIFSKIEFRNFDSLEKEIFDSLERKILTVWKGKFWQFENENFDSSKGIFWRFKKKNFDILEKENFDSLKRKNLTVWKGKFWQFEQGHSLSKITELTPKKCIFNFLEFACIFCQINRMQFRSNNNLEMYVC